MVCENCGKQHNGLFGSGRFCCKSCAVSFTNKQRTLKEETRNKISETLKILHKPKIKYCKFCGSIIQKPRTQYCCKEHRIIFAYRLPTLIKYFAFDTTTLGTHDAIKEYDRIRQMLYNLYWTEHKSSADIAKMFNYTTHVENITNKLFKMLDIPKKSVSQAVHENYLSGKLNNIQSNSRYKCGWHSTWSNKQVYLRSSYELDYAKQLDESKTDYEVETLRIRYFCTKDNKYKVAIPDFYIPTTNTIVEVKSNYTLDVGNMRDKVKSYIENGYNFKLILEHKEIDIDKIEIITQ